MINDYIRVKNLFHKTDIPIFKTALNEVEKRIVDLQKKLHQDLQTMPITVEQQKRLIRYLVNLDAPVDSAWDAIKARSEYINKKFSLIYDYHKSLDRTDGSKTPKASSGSKYSKYSKTPNTEVAVIPACVNFTDEICLSITETFPDLWKIGQAYFSGELQVKVEAGRQVEYKHMVINVMETFCKYVRASLIPNTLEKSERSQFGSFVTPDREELALYLPELLQSVRTTYSSLIKLDLPSDALDIVNLLLLDLRIHCMSVLLQQATEQTKQLNENWKINYSGKYTGVTELPLKFLTLIEDVVNIVKDSALVTEIREISLLDSQPAQKEMEKQMNNLLTAFHNVLNNLSLSEDYDDDEGHVVSQLIGTPVSSHKTSSQSNIPIWEHRLLITLSNCLFTKTTALKIIGDQFKEHNFPSLNTPLESAHAKLEHLEKSILDKYLEQKSDPLVGTIEPSMYLGRFDWHLTIPPTDIRPYVKECINNLINVHSEIIHISPTLLRAVLPQVVETVAEELYRLMSCVQRFSREGAVQARADIMALQEFLQDYTTEKAKQYFSEAVDVVPQVDRTDEIIIEDILRQCKARMKIQVLCLRNKQ